MGAYNLNTEQMIRTYKRNMLGTAEGKFTKEAAALGHVGWRVQSHSQSTALGKIFTITVVYVRDAQGVQQPEQDGEMPDGLTKPQQAAWFKERGMGFKEQIRYYKEHPEKRR